MKKLISIVIIAIIVIVIVLIKPMTHTNNNNSNNKDDDIIIQEPENNEANIPEREEASYEEWLASSMIMSLTLQEDQFNIQGIYYKNKTELENKMDSQGVYVVYKAEGKQKVIYSKPLEKARNQKGTIDLYSQLLEYSTYEYKDINSININEYKTLEEEALNPLINQLLLVSLYEN